MDRCQEEVGASFKTRATFTLPGLRCDSEHARVCAALVLLARGELDAAHEIMEAQIGMSGLKLKKTGWLSTLRRSKKDHPMVEAAKEFGQATEFVEDE